MNIKPITPKQADGIKIQQIPDFVIRSFNELITKEFNGYSAIIKQKDVMVLAKKYSDCPEKFEYQWLDVEEVYKKAGWKVQYDRPGYNESYDAYFEFRK